MVWVATAWLTGALAAMWGILQNPILPAALAGTGLCAGVALRRNPRWRPASIVICFLGAGAVWWNVRILDANTDAVSERVRRNPGGAYTLEGFVRSTSLILPGEDRVRFVLDIKRIEGSDGRFNTRGRAIVYWTRDAVSVLPTERVVVRGTGEVAIATVNPGIDSYEDYLRRRGVHTAFNAAGPGAVERVRGPTWWSPYYLSAALRETLARRLAAAVPGHILPFVYAVWLGQQSGLPQAEYNSYVWSGTAHMLSVSGVHASIICLSLMAALRLMQIARRARAVIAMLAALLYALTTGAGIASVRAAMMLCTYLTADLFNREPDAATALGLSGLAFMIWDPDVVSDLGFQLSFLSIASILLFHSRFDAILSRIPRTLRGMLASGLAVQLLPLPVVADYFHVVSLTAPLANLIVIPLLAAVLWLCFAASLLALTLPPLAPMFGYALVLPIELIRGTAGYASVPELVLSMLPSPTPLAWALFWTAAFVFAAAPRTANPLRMRLHIATLALFASSLGLWNLRGRDPEIVFLDVGHGDAAVVRTQTGETVVIDAGDRNEFADYGQRVVGPFLLARGISSIDLAVATHTDRDHMGGLIYLVEHFPVGCVLLGPVDSDAELEKELLARCEKRGVIVRRAGQGERIQVGSTSIDVLGPPQEWARNATANDRSLVLRVPFGPASVLFAGDIEAPAEAMLGGTDLRASVLKVPHHGADTSSSPEFIEAVSPDYAVISTGARGRQVLDEAIVHRYRNAGIRVLRTDRVGGITLSADDNQLTLEGERVRRGYPVAEQ